MCISISDSHICQPNKCHQYSCVCVCVRACAVLHDNHYTVCLEVTVLASLSVHRSKYPPKMTADAMNDWYEQILELSKKIGEISVSVFFKFIF